MPRRSSRNTGGGDAPAPKKAKHSFPQIDGVEVQFEWKGDGKNQWIKYPKKVNKTLAKAYVAKEKQVELDLTGGAVVTVVSFDKMVQKNKKTGFERSIQVGLKTSANDEFIVIQWQDDHDPSSWNPYTIPTSLEIEEAFRMKSKTVTTQTTPKPYLIDLKKMIQTNVQTKFSRKIRRVPTSSEEDPSGEEDDGEGDEVKEENKDEMKEENDEEEEEEEDIKPVKSGRGKSGSKASKSKAGSSSKSAVRTVVLKKGSVPVDDTCPIASKTCVYESGNIIWDCMLNQTNIANNNNKYFLIQVLYDESCKHYYVWLRWGRVGYGGQTNLIKCQTDLDSAKKTFAKKFWDKTRNDWANKDSFQKYPGKYDLLKMGYNVEEEDQVDVEDEKVDDEKVPDSTLDMRIQDLVQLICDVKSMEDAVIEMKYDAKKAPLGKLTKGQIKAGYLALKEIEALIDKKDFGRNLSEACSEFYTRIPHEFGMQAPPLIRSPQDLKKKLQLLEALEDIEIAIKMLKGGNMSENPVDRQYHQLKCGLTPLDKNSDDFKLLNNYLKKTHASTHMLYTLTLEEVFECDKEDEASQFLDHGNRMLLWHGSRLTNWAGVLGQGLRIAPPEAPVTGYMFGKGVYFADMSSKSANYCFASRAKNTGMLLLCDVSLGNVEEKIHADLNAATLPAGKHSVKGLGMVAPDTKSYITMSDGLVVPVGKESSTDLKKQAKGFTLQYNEYIVYDTKQIRMKYLLKVKFNFK